MNCIKARIAMVYKHLGFFVVVILRKAKKSHSGTQFSKKVHV